MFLFSTRNNNENKTPRRFCTSIFHFVLGFVFAVPPTCEMNDLCQSGQVFRTWLIDDKIWTGHILRPGLTRCWVNYMAITQKIEIIHFPHPRPALEHRFYSKFFKQV